MRKPGVRGFTLVEIMVVVVIIGILAVLVVPRVVGRSDDARIAAAKHDVATIQQSLKLYRLDNGRYPTNEQGLQALVAKPQSAPVPTNWRQYLDKLPKDPPANFPPYDVYPTNTSWIPPSGVLSPAGSATAEKGKAMFEEYVRTIAVALGKEFPAKASRRAAGRKTVTRQKKAGRPRR